MKAVMFKGNHMAKENTNGKTKQYMKDNLYKGLERGKVL